MFLSQGFSGSTAIASSSRVLPWARRFSHLPNFELELAVAVDRFEIVATGGDEASSVRARGEGDEYVEVQVSEFLRGIGVLGTYFFQNLARFEPISFGRRQNRIVLAKGSEEFSFRRRGGATPEFGQNYSRVTNQTAEVFDPLAVAAGAQVVD